MPKTTISPEEIEKFSAIADQWWDPHGKFKPLHQFNPLRLGYIREKLDEKFSSLNKVTLLDIGCGGGLLSEPMARLGCDVTAVDASEKNIKTAMLHGEANGLKINYLVSTAEDLAQTYPEKFDVILNMEVIEHVADPKLLIDSCFDMLKPGGLLFVATLNRTLKSYLFAIIGAEYVLRWLPVGTHQWDKFLKPSQIDQFCSQFADPIDHQGAIFNPFTQKWSLGYDDSVNYISVYEKRT